MRGEPTNRGGRLVGRYVVHDRIAAGGMATVHLGRLLGPAGFSRTVAIKRLHDGYARDPDFVAMLLDEARLAATIRHPNVVPTLDVVAEGDELLVVMDYIEGDSVAHLAKLSAQRGMRIPPALAVTVIVQALHGLHAAHEARDRDGLPLGIVHRDVSPQNILVGADGIARVLDFGIAKAASRATATEDGQVKGKTAYMAPEQLQHAAVDRRTDIFAAGVCLWELLTARRLFLADSPQAIMAKVLNGAIQAPHLIAGDVPQAVGEIVLRSLERDVDKRFATAEEMALLLEDAIKLPRAKEVGAWVTDVASTTLAARAELVQIVERSSHRIEAMQSTDPELQAAIQEAERRRQMTDQETDMGAGSGPRSPLATPRSAPQAFTPAGPSGPITTPATPAAYQTPRTGPHRPSTPGAPSYPSQPPPYQTPPDQLTQLSTSHTSHGFSQPPPPARVSRVSLALGLMGAMALLIALGVGFVVTRPSANAGSGKTSEPPPPPSTLTTTATTPPPPPTETTAPIASTPAPPVSTSKTGNGKPPRPPIPGPGPNTHGTAKPGCDPPWDFDSKGMKHFKPECL